MPSDKIRCKNCGRLFYRTVLGWKVKFCPYCAEPTDEGKGKE